MFIPIFVPVFVPNNNMESGMRRSKEGVGELEEWDGRLEDRSKDLLEGERKKLDLYPHFHL